MSNEKKLNIEKIKSSKESSAKDESLMDYNINDQELLDKIDAIEMFKKQYKEGNYKEARQTLSMARLDHHPQIMYYNGLLEMRENNLDQAINFFKRVISFERSDFIVIQSYICLGLIFTKRGNYKLAIMHLDVLVNSGAESAQIYSMLGYCYMELKNYNMALDSYQQALEFDPNSIGIANSMGYILILLGRTEEGINYIRKALQAEPENYAYLHSMGMYYLIRKEFKIALDYFKQSFAIKKHPLVKDHMEICRKKGGFIDDRA